MTIRNSYLAQFLEVTQLTLMRKNHLCLEKLSTESNAVCITGSQLLDHTPQSLE